MNNNGRGAIEMTKRRRGRERIEGIDGDMTDENDDETGQSEVVEERRGGNGEMEEKNKRANEQTK